MSDVRQDLDHVSCRSVRTGRVRDNSRSEFVGRAFESEADVRAVYGKVIDCESGLVDAQCRRDLPAGGSGATLRRFAGLTMVARIE